MSLSKKALIGLYLPILIATLATSLLLSALLPNSLPPLLSALIVGLAAVCLSVAIIHWRLIRPMAGFSSHLRQCAQGQADCLQELETHHRHPFLGEIARSTQHYITHFHDLGRNLSQCGGNISIAAAEVSHFIDQLKKKIEGDVREITEIAASANQMAQTSSQAADSADEAATAATETRDESHQGLLKVQGAIQQIHGVSESVVQTSTLVGKLQEHSNKIQGIAQVIDGLADQTNLLALNAAIEAARAGENGRGFSVVADEVRGLANKTTTATGEIGEMLKEVKNDTTQAVTIMESLVQRMSEMVASTEQVGSVLEEIGQYSQQSESKVQQIVASINESASATSHISHSVDIVREGLERSEHEIQSVSNQALELSDMGEQIYELLAGLHMDTVHDRIARIAQEAAEQIQQAFESAIEARRISQSDLFDRQHKPIENTQPQKYSTAYDQLADSLLPSIQEPILQQNEAIVYAIATDPKGYVPTHNNRFCKPLTGNLEKDLVNNRTKRIFDDRTGSRCGSHTQPILLQTYKRDTGEVMHDLSVPIFVNGQHWGGFRIGYSSSS
ncbi:MAG: methyl-accepting chemotaxis protein [Candidatus Thiodiazotropha sp.]